jgi:hypothetical protein
MLKIGDVGGFPHSILTRELLNRTSLRKKYRAKHAKLAKKEPLSFRPKGEIFFRSLAYARDDGPWPATLASFAFFARDIIFAYLLLVGTIQICLARLILSKEIITWA